MATATVATTTRAREDRAIYRAIRLLDSRLRELGEIFSSPHVVENYFRLRLAAEEREHFEAAFLDAQNRLIETERLFSGTLDGSEVSSRVVVQRALHHNAAAIIFAHNHPSGNPKPSAADRLITLRLKDALSLIEVRLLDHIIIGGRNATSLASTGVIGKH